jgi:hypothetical protein
MNIYLTLCFSWFGDEDLPFPLCVACSEKLSKQSKAYEETELTFYHKTSTI